MPGVECREDNPEWCNQGRQKSLHPLELFIRLLLALHERSPAAHLRPPHISVGSGSRDRLGAAWMSVIETSTVSFTYTEGVRVRLIRNADTIASSDASTNKNAQRVTSTSLQGEKNKKKIFSGSKDDR
ncbi:hypothetical protein RRG08_054647 [Elysia crispata]|uniref:Uncharacterized protein n=1 Tax=Elysia crispata TaxID=231223 RepID=A0AAE1B2D8_9GAST|nr:hypothetical protein RRG08_054647 [Elysia crispata]